MLRYMAFGGTRVTLDNIGALSAVRRLREQLERSLVMAAAGPLDPHEKHRRADYACDLVGADEKRSVLVQKARPVFFLVVRRRLIGDQRKNPRITAPLHHLNQEILPCNWIAAEPRARFEHESVDARYAQRFI